MGRRHRSDRSVPGFPRAFARTGATFRGRHIRSVVTPVQKLRGVFAARRGLAAPAADQRSAQRGEAWHLIMLIRITIKISITILLHLIMERRIT